MPVALDPRFRGDDELRRKSVAMSAAPLLINTDFEAAIARNKRNTVFLILVLTLIAAVLGYVLGWAWGILNVIWTLPAEQVKALSAWTVLRDLVSLPPRPQALIGTAVMVIFGIVWGLITLYAGASILSAFVGSRPPDPSRPEEKRFLDVVAEMTVAAGLPRPEARVVDTPALNAFASGYDPEHAMITATSGILQTCTRDELEGVIGHEMSHIVDFDVRYATVVAAMAGVAVLVQHLLFDVLRWASWSSGGGGDRRDNAGGARMALTLVVLALVAVFAIIAPLAAKLVQLAISRQREYLADATSVKLTRDPVGLIHALQRLQQSDTAMARGSSPVSALCIAPVRSSFESMFATHPPLEDRIQRLRNLGGVTAPDTPLPPPAPPPAAPASDPRWTGPSSSPPPPHHGPWG
jgi:heat shock protein HtpX